MKELEDYLYYEEKNPDIRIYCGDCLEIMPLLDKVDLCHTDPPYGIGMDIEFQSKKGRNGYKLYDATNWDSAPPNRRYST